MSLFRRNDNQPLEFDVIGLNDDDFNRISKLIEEHGGKVVHSDVQPIKFTKHYKFAATVNPSYKVYSIEFIEDCIEDGTIVDPTLYRIGCPLMYDECVIGHFLHGPNGCHDRENKICSSNPIALSDNERGVQDKSPREELIGSTSIPNLESTTAPKTDKHLIASTSAKKTTPVKVFKTHESSSSRSEITDVPSSSEPDVKSQTSQFQTKKGRGAPYTKIEEQSIVDYLTKNGIIESTESGLTVWKKMLSDGVCPNRSANSLYRHFRNFILPNIANFQMTEQQMTEFNNIR